MKRDHLKDLIIALRLLKFLIPEKALLHFLRLLNLEKAIVFETHIIMLVDFRVCAFSLFISFFPVIVWNQAIQWHITLWLFQITRIELYLVENGYHQEQPGSWLYCCKSSYTHRTSQKKLILKKHAKFLIPKEESITFLWLLKFLILKKDPIPLPWGS